MALEDICSLPASKDVNEVVVPFIVRSIFSLHFHGSNEEEHVFLLLWTVMGGIGGRCTP